MNEQTMRGLHALLGELLDLLADVPELHEPRSVDWSIGRQPGVTVAIAVGVLTDRDQTLLEHIAGVLGGGTIHPLGRTYQQADGTYRLHTLHAELRGVPVRVIASRPEPSEREALLARLAELDAADAEGGAA
jgi:hypothetical protein